MKLKALILCFMAILIFSSVYAQEQGGNPASNFPVKTYTFDPVPEGSVAQYDFVVRNTGDAPLDISKVKSG
ncbi:MAG: DUF1573 domain-containing protein [Desulfobacterales bacterium]|nr:DUF1573 domain-containing protein [Desulfobacterales bacterium]